jgi:hypothetical protein
MMSVGVPMVQLLPRCPWGHVADSFAPGLGADACVVSLLVVVFLRPLAAAYRGLVRGCRVGAAAVLSAVSRVGVLALVLVWWRCSAIGCLTL